LRILIACLIIIIVGGILAAVFSLQPAKLDSAQLAQVQTNCAKCHSVPSVDDVNVNQLHKSHTFLVCSACHGASSGDRDSEDIHINSALCVRCHSIPEYSDAVSMHDFHAGADCAVCHTSNTGLTSVTNTYKIVRIIGIVMFILGLLGIMVNYLVARIRFKQRG
jgi:hypothetical protein